VSVSCVPAAGASFPTGVSNVQCTATDRSGQTATCTFRVTVTQPPRLRETKFLAFGDSITWGEGGPAPATATINAPRVQVSQPYPEGLRRLLAARYTAQTITVTNAGKPGERATQGQVRLPGVLGSTQPEVLLLLEGANDLNAFGAAGVESAEAALRTMVRDAKSRLGGAGNVFVATLTPMVQGRPKADGYAYVPLLNERIWELPGREGVTVVDIYAALLPQAATLISDDGLHPNQAGYDKMAETFFAALRAKYEAAPAAAPSGLPGEPQLLDRQGPTGPDGQPSHLSADSWRRPAPLRRLDPRSER
jgi:lysophospholipase L1-like esterase